MASCSVACAEPLSARRAARALETLSPLTASRPRPSHSRIPRRCTRASVCGAVFHVEHRPRRPAVETRSLSRPLRRPEGPQRSAGLGGHVGWSARACVERDETPRTSSSPPPASRRATPPRPRRLCALGHRLPNALSIPVTGGVQQPGRKPLRIRRAPTRAPSARIPVPDGYASKCPVPRQHLHAPARRAGASATGAICRGRAVTIQTRPPRPCVSGLRPPCFTWNDVAHRSRRKRFGRPIDFGDERRQRYRSRDVVERCFNKLKRWRGLAMRSDKTARSHHSGQCPSATLHWVQRISR